MNIWRMKLRAGSHGEDLWPICRKRRVAVITHRLIKDTDLTHLDMGDLNKGVKTAIRKSIWRFAWEMQGGDEIYIGDSKSKSIIAHGYINCNIGKRAYRYSSKNPITETLRDRKPWRHEVPVKWDNNFVSFTYVDWAPRYTVSPFKLDSDTTNIENDKFLKNRNLPNESPYMREIAASKVHIDRLHAELSIQFSIWLERKYGIKTIRETNQIDLKFDYCKKNHMAELKICYGGNTRHAIREAIGQIFEYNNYPHRKSAEFWWLVLDHEPSDSDLTYISTLRNKYRIPLTLCWRNELSFKVFPSLPLNI